MGALFTDPMSASRAPTATVASIATSIAKIVPVAGDGISVSTLSVETSSSGSSTVIESPTFLSQRVTVPSVTDSPSAGMVTTTPAETAAGGVAAGAASTTGEGVAGTSIGAGAAPTGATAGAGATATPSSITASSAPTATVESIATTMRVRVPDTGEGISVSTLSVDTSSRGSSTFT